MPEAFSSAALWLTRKHVKGSASKPSLMGLALQRYCISRRKRLTHTSYLGFLFNYVIPRETFFFLLFIYSSSRTAASSLLCEHARYKRKTLKANDKREKRTTNTKANARRRRCEELQRTYQTTSPLPEQAQLPPPPPSRASVFITPK